MHYYDTGTTEGNGIINTHSRRDGNNNTHTAEENGKNNICNA